VLGATRIQTEELGDLRANRGVEPRFRYGSDYCMAVRTPRFSVIGAENSGRKEQ